MTADAVGGVWTYALELADALDPHRVEVSLATMGPTPSDGQRTQAEQSAVDELHVSDYALEWAHEPWDDVQRAGEWLLELADRLQPDLVHLNGFAHGALAWQAPVLVVGHSCVLSWWKAVEGGPAPARLGPYRELVRAGLRGADLLVAPTRAFLHQLEQLYAPACERRVIPNGRRPIAPLRKQPFVLAAGRAWDEAKNLGALDRVAARVPWPVLIAGGGGDTGFRHARSLGVIEREELGRLLGRASVFAAPARYEPFGLGVLEAASAGCALVLGDIPSLRELWSGAARFVDPADEDAIAAALAEVIADERLRADLAGRARVRARLYTPERMAGGYQAAYQSLIAGPRATAVAL